MEAHRPYIRRRIWLISVSAFWLLAMEVVRSKRKALVQKLRVVARSCKVSLCRDDCGMDKVRAMVEAIRASEGPTEDKEEAERYFSAFAATFGTSVPATVGQPTGFRLRGRSFLLTYNWDFLNKALPDGTAPLCTPSSVWRLWKLWKKQKQEELNVILSTSTLERSLHSPTPDRVHLHWKVNLQEAVDFSSAEVFEFHGVRPDARPTTALQTETRKARGASFVEASNRAHFYCWVPKEGSLFRGTNYKPFLDYRVAGKWLDDLWTDHKLGNVDYGALSLKVRVGHARRRQDLEAVVSAERDAAVDVQMAEVETQLAKLRAPFRTFSEVVAWEDSFLHLDFRWKLLVLVADSASGKSSFAETRFEKPCVVTVEETLQLDLKTFDNRVNDGLVLDNVNSWGQLLLWRAVLQARNAKSKGGQSATNLYSYPQYLFGTAVVATIDLDAPDAYLADETSEWRSKWLCKNCVVLRLPRGEAFYERTAVPKRRLENTFSLFAQTVQRRRLEEPEQPAAEPAERAT